MTARQRKIVFALTLSYTILILYFIFLAFGRAGTVDRDTGYTFIFLPDTFFRLPGLSDVLHPSLMDFVSFGNIAAFIPFGILIPLLYRVGFVRFMTLFILSILVLETVQALTLLGSFDMNDVIQNSLGAAIGYGGYKFGVRTRNVRRNVVAASISIVVLTIGIWGIFGIVDKALTQELGSFVAVNERRDSAGNASTGTERSSLVIGGQPIEPQYNVYSAEGKNKETYTYQVGKKELYLYLNYGIPDEEDFRGSLKVTVDGEEFLSASAEDQGHEPVTYSLYLDGPNEVTITLEGNEKLWDFGFREMKYSWKW